MKNIEFWSKNQCVEIAHPSLEDIEHFKETLNDAQDERSLQNFLGELPHLLTCLLPPGRGAWCFDRPRLGSEFIPDFLLCTESSIGKQWLMIELESPMKSPLTRAGVPSQKLNEALAQVRDWRAWLRSNVAYAQSQLGFENLDAECEGVVVIGRRHSIDARHAVRYRELSRERTTIMTYDRLVDAMGRGRSIMEGSNG